MAAAFMYLVVLFLAITGHSSATYCICKDGVSNTVLQSNIDYACGHGSDCTQINQNGACYNPNSVKDHCNYAVNSYFQRKGQVTGSCDFQGTAMQSINPPTNVASGCVYPASSSNAGISTSTPTTTTSGTVPTNTPSTSTGTSTTSSPNVFGLSPTGSSNSIDDSSGWSIAPPTGSLWFSSLVLLLLG